MVLGLPDSVVGPAAGVLTSTLWVFTSLFFTAAGRRIGSTRVNAARLFMAVGLHGVTHLVMFGSLWPETTGEQTLYLAMSGLVGLTICDQLLFTAFLDVGPRLALLVMTTAPLFALLLGAAFLGETVGWSAAAGIALTLAGVVWVVLERPETARDRQTHPHFGRGIALAVLAAGCQAGGLLLSKKGIGYGLLPPDERLPAQSATFVRMVFGAAGVIPIVAAFVWRRNGAVRRGQSPEPARGAGKGYMLTLCGAMVGPYLGVWASLVAVDRTPLLGVAQTLLCLPPVLILPVSVFWLRERISPRAAIGACIAVVGAGLLFFA